jgi:hypothetical protein
MYILTAFHYKSGEGYYGEHTPRVQEKRSAHQFHYPQNARTKAMYMNEKAAKTGIWYELEGERHV